MKRIFPPKLKKGDTIGVIAPCYAITREYTEPLFQALDKLGYRVKCSRHLFSSANEYAGSVEERSADFNDMIADPEVKAVLFCGGEVCNEILPYIDYDGIRKHPKILCSYSDSTSVLNAVHSMTGLITFYGTAPRAFIEGEEYNLRSFEQRTSTLDCVCEKSGEWKVIYPGRCQGTLTGGYLINYAALFATPYFRLSDDKEYVLFVEDHRKFSEPAVVSKRFSNLEMYGGMKNVTGIIMGHYSEDEYPAIDDILRRLGEKYQIPVVRCDDFGHGKYMSVFPIGVECYLNTQRGTFEFLEPAVSEM